MNTWKTLYLKEMKENRTLFIFLLASTACLEIVALLSFDDGQVMPSPHFLWSFLPYGWFLILPFFLIHSFAQEFKGQTHYLLLSLPISRTQIFAAKAAVVVTISTLLFILSTAGLSTVFVELQTLAERVVDIQFSLSMVDLWVLTSMFYVSAMAVMLGIASGIVGLKLVVRRFPGLAATMFAICVLYFYLSTLPDVLALPAVFGTYEASVLIDSTSPDMVLRMGHPETIVANYMFVVYSLVVGLAAMGLGMWLFEKRAEA